MLVKAYTFYITSSNAILSDALESLVNIASGTFALVSLKIASRPSDKNHPYGHGKVEFISGFIEGTLIIIAGLMMIGKATYNIIVPNEVRELMLGILLTSITGFVNYAMGYKLKQQGQQKGSMIMISEGSHLMSDGYTSLALIIGIGVVWVSGFVILDNIISILFGIYVLYMGYKIFRKSIAGIMDEMDMDLADEFIDELNKERKPEWIDVHNLRIIKFGRDVHVDCHITLPWYLNLEETHEQVECFEKVFKRKFEPQSEFFIHTDPCIESSCQHCSLSNCNVRKHPFKKKVDWTVKNILENSKH
jgi:cation diffusion facilitator family transporter